MTTTTPAEYPPISLAGAAWIDRHRWWLFTFIALLYAAAFNGQWRLAPDSVLYASIGRSIAEGAGYAHPMGNESRANPLLPILIAGSTRVFGDGVMWPVLVFETLCALAALALTYRVIVLHAGRERAAIVVIMLGVSANLLRHSIEVLNDVPFLVGVLLVIWGEERRRHNEGPLAGNIAIIASGFVLMTSLRIIVFLVAAAYVGGLFWELLRVRRAKAAAMIVVATLLPLVLIRAMDPRGLSPTIKEQELLTKVAHVGSALVHKAPGNARELFGHVTMDATLGNPIGPAWLGFAPSITVLLAAIIVLRRRPFWSLLILFSVIQWALFFADRRYFLPIQPLLLFAILLMIEWVKSAAPPKLGRALAVGAFAVFFGMNTAKAIGIIATQHRRPFDAHYADGRFVAIREFAREAGARVGGDGLILADPQLVEPLIYFGRVRARGIWPSSILDDAARSLYVVEPMDTATRAWIGSSRLDVGEVIFTMPRGGTLPEWQLRRVTNHAQPASQPASMPSMEEPAVTQFE